ncbi:MAG: glycosyltransferase [Prevotella sp.]|nr:glycosyltransferase [Prevotella sp.]
MNEIKVSVIVPIYKVPERFLRQCIESLTGQTLREIEIILVDDGSPDRCGEICDEYAEKDRRIKVIHKKNEGLAAARNSGFDIVAGDAMMFVDGDDYLDTQTCEVAYRTMIEKNVQAVLFNQKIIYPSSILNTPVCKNPPEAFNTNLECRELQARVLDFNGWMATATSKLVNVEYMRKYNIRHNTDLRQGVEGFVFNIYLFEHMETAYYLPDPYYNYVYNETSITHTPNIENNILIIKGLEFIDNYGKQHSVSKNFRKNLLNRVLICIITTAIQGCFNPVNSLSFKKQVAWYSNYLNMSLVQDAIKNANREGLNFQRKLMLFLIENRCYRCLRFFAWLRRKQLSNR